MEAELIDRALAVFGPPGAFIALLVIYAVNSYRNGPRAVDPMAARFAELEKTLVHIRERLARIEGKLDIGD